MIKVLIPTDFSDHSTKAFEFAVRLLKSLNVHYHFVHAYNANVTLADEVSSGLDHELFTDRGDYLEAEMKEWIKSITSFQKHGDELSFSVSIGSLTKVLKNKTKNKHYHFVVMGTQGATGAKEIFLGSSTVDVIKEIRNTPVIAVPVEYNFNDLKKVIIATAFKYELGSNNLSSLLLLNKYWNFELDIINVNGEQENLTSMELKIKEDLFNILSGIKVGYTMVRKDSSISKTIMEYGKKNDIDLIGLVYKKHSFLERLFREPVVKKVAFYSEVPLMVFPD